MKLFKYYFLLLIGFFITNSLIKADDFSVKFGGFVKTDIYYDTRQSFGLREQHIYMWPLNVKTDGNNQDINDEASFHILPIQTRVFMSARGPGIFGGTTSGYIEGEFLGSTDASINSLRLRHAFVDLDFKNTKIRTGQFWHPMFATENFPEVLSFNTGVPTIPFNRSPQIRISQKIDNFTLMVAAVGQRDFANQGPDGTSNKYLRNAGFPELVVGTSFSSADFKAGVTASTKTIKPYTTHIFPSTFPGNWPPTDFKVNDKLTTYSASAYARVKIENFYIKTQATYGENLSEFLMIGGYGVTNIDSTNRRNYSLEYDGIGVFACWLELMWKKDWEIGVFGAYTETTGDYERFTGPIFGIGKDIYKLYRISPRIAYNFNKTRIGLETEYTTAFYHNGDGSVDNIRFLMALFVFF